MYPIILKPISVLSCYGKDFFFSTTYNCYSHVDLKGPSMSNRSNYPGVCLLDLCQQVRGGNLSLLLSPGKAAIGVLCAILDSSARAGAPGESSGKRHR